MILKNKYNSAMDNIIVTRQMEERILNNLLLEKEIGEEIKQQTPKQAKYNWVKYVGVIAACCTIIVSVKVMDSSFLKNHNQGNKQTRPQIEENIEGSSSQNNEQKDSELGANPIVDMSGIEELKKTVTFELFLPEKLPKEYKIESTSLIGGELAQVTYSDGINDITFRTAEGKKDVSGDNTSFDKTVIVKISGTKVTLKGSNSVINLATWTKDGLSYSLSFSSGVTKKDVQTMIKSMKKA